MSEVREINGEGNPSHGYAAESALLTLTPHEARTAGAVFDRLFPADENSPGATEIGAVIYLDRALSGPYADDVEVYRLGLSALDRAARARQGAVFAALGQEQQDAVISGLERGELAEFNAPPQHRFFELLHRHMREGVFSDPAYGGNRDKLGWRFLQHPGVWLENSEKESLSEKPANKGGRIQSLEDLGYSLNGSPQEREDILGYDPQNSVEPPSGVADVVLVGLGAVGGLVAPVLAEAGLRVMALEAGPWRTKQDYLPDELGSAHYSRGGMGPKFSAELPRWRRNEGEPTSEATFSLGRMMNSVGGTVIRYAAWLRRFHPYHFRHLSHVRENFGEHVLPESHTLADWPVSYDDLEPYYSMLDRIVGISGGDEDNPFIRRSEPYPMPPLRPFRMGEIFRRTTMDMGLHPHMVPAGVNSAPYDGRPATRYPGFGVGFGPFDDDKWNPSLSSVPRALATGNLDLKTHCRAVRVLTNRDGRASGVEYVDANGDSHVQQARTVILCGYTFENVRLLLVSADERHSGGLGNNLGQVGKHFMSKMFADVHGYFPDAVFNRHTGPAAQAVVLDDFLAEGLDYEERGFVGGATLGTENQALPIFISREPLPSDVPRWGKAYKDHIRQWQQFCPVRIQPDTLSYRSNFLDLDPRHRDRSGLGLPLVRITYDLRPNESRLADWAEGKAEEILRAMGAQETWRGPRFTGVMSSHDLGGCRMGEDPASSVVDADLRVHDTPGLYVFGGATFPTCPGINPMLTIWAICLRAAERLVDRLGEGEE